MAAGKNDTTGRNNPPQPQNQAKNGATPPATGSWLTSRTVATKGNIAGYLRMPEVQGTLDRLLKSSGMTHERFEALAMQAVVRNPDLMECTVFSVGQALAEAAELGLEPGSSALSECWLVPYWNKDRRVSEAQLMVGYRGEIHLFLRAGGARAEAVVVRACDRCHIQRGTEPKIDHEIRFEGDAKSDTRVIGYYAIAWFPDGTFQFETMSQEAVDAHRKAYASEKSKAWNDPLGAEEMGKKTVWRKLKKYLKLRNDAFEKSEDYSADSRRENSIIIGTAEILDEDPPPPAEAPGADAAPREEKPAAPADPHADAVAKAAATPAPKGMGSKKLADAVAKADAKSEPVDPGPCPKLEHCLKPAGHDGECSDGFPETNEGRVKR